MAQAQVRDGLTALVARWAEVQGGGPGDVPWRFHLTEDAWRDLLACLVADPSPFVGMWCDGRAVFVALAPQVGEMLVVSTPVEMQRYWGLSCACPAAGVYERMIHDLWGVEALDARDLRPWLDHGAWGVTWPLSDRPVPVQGANVAEFREVAEVMRAGGTICEYGPADGGFHAPAYLRLAVPGARVVDAQWWMGYAHRGIGARMRGSDPAQALRLAARIDGAASVAHQAALARAMEQALRQEVAGQVATMRAMFCELERVATVLFDVGGVAEAAGDVRLARECAQAREHVLAFCDAAFGRRMLMDVVTFGGDGGDAAAFASRAEEVCTWLRGAHARLEALYRHPRGLGGLVRGLGVLSADMARQLGVTGVVARASGREGDLRHLVPGYHDGWLPAGVEQAGDVDARMRVRLRTVGVSLRILDALGGVLSRAQPAADTASSPVGDGEGTGWAEGPRGAIRYWVRMQAGQLAAVGICESTPAHMLASEIAMHDAHDTDMPVIMRSFGLSPAGADL
ncbi:Ni Fe-hydrogenase III large subunit-like protein [Gluconacetobacter entanii]|uniref:Ni Fe-hydrogenase III large subunit-like protein n=1 Tax=Gluconacetobacter entanii TaxID=108528 RepID=A0ABT3K6U2_9PROT|nr:Ni Fe-hydrogenase III large subunit-like protein [Gluconacetobacter entanii]MCW4591083.1 Ni Fe-hydrogenase III large subunit-like protein [Gluconacetobacter entanii]MCW4594527.1 Ni Fe-hydrogenase III large subunit-like protein [Gluconacetobacter entanii]NPC88697.1 Ni Fe-hydrogenase III large subunit-like protein [Gluconacetobacter entanii]